MRALIRRAMQRVANWRNRPILLRRYREHLGIYCGQVPPKPIPPMPISSERALGNLNEAWARLHRAMHRPVAPDELRACRDSHREALEAYTIAAGREFGR